VTQNYDVSKNRFDLDQANYLGHAVNANGRVKINGRNTVCDK